MMLSTFPRHKAEGGQPLYKSDPRTGKHSDPVWQVCWQRTDSHELQLCSVSTDGRVTLWTASKNELSHQDMLELRGLRGKDEASPVASPRPPTSGSGQGTEPEEGDESAAGIAGAGVRGEDAKGW